MTQPTQTHKPQSGRFEMVARYNGGTAPDAQMIVIYHDLDRVIETATTAKDREQNWKEIALHRLPGHRLRCHQGRQASALRRLTPSRYQVTCLDCGHVSERYMSSGTRGAIATR